MVPLEHLSLPHNKRQTAGVDTAKRSLSNFLTGEMQPQSLISAKVESMPGLVQHRS